ncbi:MAG: type IX secretion system membrane protein PorP/SprF [Bacteroidota bacterium]
MKKLLISVILLISMSSYAQQDPLFSQYMFNKLAINPAYAGSTEMLSIDLLSRYQWVGIKGAPKTITLSLHSPLRNNHMGLGLYLYGDFVGPTVTYGLMGSYAYRMRLGKGKLCLGLQVGIKYFSFDWQKINVQDPDYVFGQQQTKKFTPDANFGIYYYSKKFFAGLSTKDLFQNASGMSTVDGKNTYTKLLRHFYGMAGVNIPISDKVSFRPSVLAKYVAHAPVQCDINVSFMFNNLFWIGASYRTEKAVVLLTEFHLGKKLRVGYSYDMYLGKLMAVNKGSHEIRLGLDFDVFNSRMLTPRYFHF